MARWEDLCCYNYTGAFYRVSKVYAELTGGAYEHYADDLHKNPKKVARIFREYAVRLPEEEVPNGA